MNQNDALLGGAFVSPSPSWNLRPFDGFLKQQGRNDRTTMRVVTDGDDGFRNLLQRSMSKPIEAQLDWFHIGMRVEHLRKVVSLREFGNGTVY